MLIYKSGDILKSNKNIICHQVNVQGVMGGGLALQIAKAYPKVEKSYSRYCVLFDYDYEKLKGDYQKVTINNNQYIFNCFTQKKNFETDYKEIKKCFSEILEFANFHNLSVAVPYGYGCGIATGNWDEVKQIFTELSEKYNRNIYVYVLTEDKK